MKKAVPGGKEVSKVNEDTFQTWIPYAMRVLLEIWGRENNCEVKATLMPKSGSVSLNPGISPVAAPPSA